MGCWENLVDRNCIRRSWGLSLLRARARSGLQANRLRLRCSSTGGCRAVASCASRGLPDPQSPNELSRVMSGETAKVGVQLVERLSRLRGRGKVSDWSANCVALHCRRRRVGLPKFPGL